MGVERMIQWLGSKDHQRVGLCREHSQREIERSVRHISESAELLSGDHLLIAVDGLGIAAGVGQIPSMKKLKAGLEERGFRMARCQMPEPMFATDADWNTVLEVTQLAE